jgi:hypothetical protein
MANNPSLEEIKEKLRNLRALQHGNTTEGEAAAAAAMISKLLQKYALREEDLIEEDEETIFMRRTIDFGTTNPEAVKWRGNLLNTLATYNFCKAIRELDVRKDKEGYYVYSKSRYSKRKRKTIAGKPIWTATGKYFLVGEPHNVEAVQSLYMYISEEIVFGARSHWRMKVEELDLKQLKHPSLDEKTLAAGKKAYAEFERKFKTAYRRGAVSRINERFAEQYRLDVNTVPNQHALKRINRELEIAVKEMQDEAGFEPRALALRETKVNAAGYRGGREKGKSIKIQEEFGGTRVALASEKQMALNA